MQYAKWLAIKLCLCKLHKQRLLGGACLCYECVVHGRQSQDLDSGNGCVIVEVRTYGCMEECILYSKQDWDARQAQVLSRISRRGSDRRV